MLFLNIEIEHKIEEMVHLDFLQIGECEVWQIRGNYILIAPSGRKKYQFIGRWEKGRLSDLFSVIDRLKNEI